MISFKNFASPTPSVTVALWVSWHGPRSPPNVRRGWQLQQQNIYTVFTFRDRYRYHVYNYFCEMYVLYVCT